MRQTDDQTDMLELDRGSRGDAHFYFFKFIYMTFMFTPFVNHSFQVLRQLRHFHRVGHHCQWRARHHVPGQVQGLGLGSGLGLVSVLGLGLGLGLG